MDKNEELFNELMIEMYPKVMKFIRHWCKDRNLAEDIAQEAFETVYKKRDRLDGHENPQGWVMEVAKHKILKMVLDEEKYYDTMVPLDEVTESRLGREYDMTDNMIAEEMLAGLSEKEADLLREYYIKGSSAQNMSKKLKISMAAFRMRLSRAKKKAKKIIKLEEYT